MVSVQDLDRRLEQVKKLKELYDQNKRKSDEAYALFEQEKDDLFKILQSINRDAYSIDGVGTIYTVERGGYKMPEGLAEKARIFGYIQSKYGQDTLESMLTIKDTQLNQFAKAEAELLGRTPEVFGEYKVSKQISFRKGK